MLSRFHSLADECAVFMIHMVDYHDRGNDASYAIYFISWKTHRKTDISLNDYTSVVLKYVATINSY